jgi:ureidoglycolate hydrolase
MRGDKGLFTWFYAVRSEELYSMQYFWEKAQSQSAGAWDVSTIMGVYHRPLVLLDKDSSYQITTYELEKEP